VVVTTTGFSVLARFTGKAGGVPDLRIAEYPGPLGIHDATRIEHNIGQTLIDQIVEGLTLTDERTSSGSVERDPRATVFTGTTEEVSHEFNERAWSDGLPILRPTIARIESQALAHPAFDAALPKNQPDAE